MKKIKYIAMVARWFDRINGNTYHSVQIIRTSDKKRLYCRFQYGYGDAYRQTALSKMASHKWIPKKYHETLYKYERENEYPIEWIISDGRKRDCVALGKEMAQ